MPKDIKTHGASAYRNRGCRCEICTKGNTILQQEYERRRKLAGGKRLKGKWEGPGVSGTDLDLRNGKTDFESESDLLESKSESVPESAIGLALGLAIDL